MHASRQLRRVIRIFVLLGMLAVPALPQASTSSVRGVARDQTGAVIVGASVTLTNTATSVTSKSSTNEAGYYLFPGVVPGEYRLFFDAPGMEKFEATLTVQVQQDAVVDAELKIGTATTQVSVKDVTSLVTVDNATLGTVLERQRIEQLPINGRFVQSLLQTVPGMEGTRTYGEQRGTLEWVVDGAVISDRFQDNLRRPPSLDTVEEFKVETNNSSARFTRPTTVVLSTKSGTNQFHGTAFETARNNGFGVARARTDFYSRPPHLVRNEFGSSAGGPVLIPKVYNGRNRTFWFFGWEGYRNMSSSTSAFQVPTAAMRAGDFRGLMDAQGRQIRIYDPLTTDPVTWARQQFSYGGQANVIDPARLNPLAKYLYSITPLPTLPNVNPLVDSNWFGPVPNPQRHFMLTGRFDHRFSEKDNFYVRATRNTYDVVTSTGGNLPLGLPTLNPEVNNYQNSAPNADLAISEVHIFSPTLFNEFLVSARRDTRGVNNNRSTAWADTLGLPNPLDAAGWPYLFGTGLNTLLYVSGGKQGSAENLYLLDDGFTKVRGPHQLQFGAHVRLDQMNVLPDLTGALGVHDWGTAATAVYDPTSSRANPLGTPQTGQNLANMFLGVMNYSTRFSRGYYYTRSQEYALYLQDNYKVTPRLTLNLGLRWELWPALSEKNYAMSSWDPKNRAVILGQDLNTLYRMGATLPSIVNRLQALGAKFETYKDAGLPQSLRYGNSKNFGPRLGFAYRGGDGKAAFVVRGGYRISYFAPVVQQWTADMRFETPFEAQFQTQLNNAAQSPDGIPNYLLRSVPTTFAGVNSRNAVDLSNAGSITRGTERLVYFDPHQPASRVQDWNLTIEKPIGSSMVARVGYVGNHSDHLQQTYFYNDPAPDYVWYKTTGLAFPTGEYAGVARRPYDQTTFGTYEEYLKSGYSNFNGMQFELERRYQKGFAYQVFYNMNNALAATGQINSADQFLPGTVPTDFDQLNRFQNYGRDTGIPKHSVRWNWIVDLPFGKGRPIGRNAGGVLNKVIGGWQLAGLGFLRSTWFALPTGIYPNDRSIEFYGYKYPIQDCRSGTCWPGYLWWNGYIPANQINSVDANGKPNGVEGVPANYKPAAQPILPWPANPNRSDPNYQFYGTNTIFVPLKNGTLQRTTYNTGLSPWQNQFFLGVRQWNMDASLFKTVSLHDRVRLRFNIDFFNVFNHPGNPAAIGSDGILDTRASGNPARVLQLTMRLSW